jgi:hypothetical protein
MYKEEDCIKALRKAKEIIGHTPSQSEYLQLDISPSSPRTIVTVVGSWNGAKKKAGLKELDSTSRGGGRFGKKPNLLDMNEDMWKSLTADKRSYLKKKCKLAEIKLETGCENCGHSGHPDTLDFHHKNPEEKEFNVSGYLHGSISWNKTVEEISKCEVLCANCHRVIDSYEFNLSEVQ